MEGPEAEVVLCNGKNFQIVKQHIKEMQLDNRMLAAEQFVVSLLQNDVIGFGRLRNYSLCSEIGSIGVLTKYRGKGVGKKIVTKLIENFYAINRNRKKELYVVTIIPAYFQKFGFRVIEDPWPKEIVDKYSYCTKSLSVPEKYVVMKLKFL